MSDIEKENNERLTNNVLRQQSAEAVLNNSEFKRFWIEYRAQLFDKILSTKGDEVDKREEFYRQLKSLGIMEANFKRSIQTGKMAQEELSRMQKLAKAAKNMIG